MSWITPEIALFDGLTFHWGLLNLFTKVWRDGEVFEEWRNAMVTPLP